MSVPDWTHLAIDIPSSGRSFEQAASASGCAAIAADLGILSCDAFAAHYRIAAAGGGSYHVTGRVTAKVTQACVVTLEPVEETIDEPIDVTFSPDAAAPAPAEPTPGGEHEVEILSVPEIEPLAHGRLDIGRVAFEIAAAALDPYPRREGASLDWTDPKATPDSASPFAALAALKKTP